MRITQCRKITNQKIQVLHKLLPREMCHREQWILQNGTKIECMPSTTLSSHIASRRSPQTRLTSSSVQYLEQQFNRHIVPCSIFISEAATFSRSQAKMSSSCEHMDAKFHKVGLIRSATKASREIFILLSNNFAQIIK